MKFSFPSARRSAVAAVLAVGLAATGCSAINYQATTHVYSASDGAMFDVEDVMLRHIMLVGGEEGGPGRLIGLVKYTDTTADDPIDVDLTVAGETFTVTVEPGQAVNLQNDDEHIVPSMDAGPGGLQEVTVSVDGTEETFQATIVDGAIAEYRDLLPDGYDESMSEHLEHGPDTWGSGAAHYEEDDAH